MVSTLLQMNSAFNDSDRNPSEFHAILHETRSDENEEELHCVSLICLYFPHVNSICSCLLVLLDLYTNS